MLPNLNLPVKASVEELRACLIDGAVLCRFLNRLRPGSVSEVRDYDHSSGMRYENVKKFLEALDALGMPGFEIADLEKGSMKTVLECILTLKAHTIPTVCGNNFPFSSSFSKSGNIGPQVDDPSRGPTPCGEDRQKSFSESKFQRALRSPVKSEPSAALIYHVGHKFHEVFQLKQGRYADIPAAKLTEMMKSNSLDNAPTQSLLSVVNGILDESVERKNEEIPHRVACLLRKVVQEIERRISTQAEHLRTQNNLFKSREEKYQSRIRVLETLATGTNDENQIVLNHLQQIKKKKDQSGIEISALKQELEIANKEKDQNNIEITALKQELEIARKTYEEHFSEMEKQGMGDKAEFEKRSRELEQLLADSRNKINKLEAYSGLEGQRWDKKEQSYLRLVNFLFSALQGLRSTSESIKKEVLETQKSYSEDFKCLGVKLKALVDASENYHAVLAENRRLYNEVQDLKGNIRVYCRIRPFLRGQNGKQTTIEYIGEDGELGIVNPSKQGKDSHRLFKFNKVYGPAATQAEVFSDTQPLVRSVLDGYNVCIFAYGQTGSGKTYTMTGPNAASKEEWGVNYRALSDLFEITQSRRSSFMYEIGVQMVEIYNEQVRDLLSSDMKNSFHPHGLAVPDATMLPVKSTSDVMELMDIGQKNRSVGATAMNERSSRSHSIVTIHAWGTDLKTGASLRGSLHLVDLAGSERVDRSEVTGERLREAQHINKSLSALGDVIFALAQKSSHVPYRNSKLTQVLQSSLGGQAKTLMFVQLNPDVNSFSETASTLKFAERVSGVELGAARSSKEGRDVKELMDQVASLKDTIAKKDEEIERLQLLKDLKNVHPGLNCERSVTGSFKYGSSPPSRNFVGGTAQLSQKLPGGKGLGPAERAASDQDNSSEYSDKHSDADSQQSMEDFKQPNESLRKSKLAGGDIGQNNPADASTLGFGETDCDERSSDTSDGGFPMRTENNGPAQSKASETTEKSKPASRITRPPQRTLRTSSPPPSHLKDSPKAATGM
uniref:Kinesin-like protein n=1 Tax=Vitis vinifera TaxID=29760 RepID=F6GTL1_VITVI